MRDPRDFFPPPFEFFFPFIRLSEYDTPLNPISRGLVILS
jgi:hypothetical protein